MRFTTSHHAPCRRRASRQGLLAHLSEKRLNEIGPGDFRMRPGSLLASSRQKVLRSLQDLETRIAKKKEMQIWSFHQLRHSFCSSLVRNGVSVEAVRVLAGHADLKTTQRYVHASAANLKAAVLTLAR